MKRFRDNSMCVDSENNSVTETGKRESTKESEDDCKTAHNCEKIDQDSGIAFVRELIDRNKKEIRPKKQMKPMELLNYAFCLLGEKAAAVSASSTSTTSTDAVKISDFIHEPSNDCVSDLHQLIDEFATVHHTLPKSNSIARVLYHWSASHNKQMIKEGIALVEKLLEYREKLPSAFASSIDERVVTIAFRLFTSTAERSYKKFIERLLHELPTVSFKRRMFHPLLEYAATHGDVEFALHLLRESERREIELWDEDYYSLLVCLSKMKSFISESDSVKKDSLKDWSKEQYYATEMLLEHLSRHHPVVGNYNALLLQELLSAEECRIDSEGRCSNCLQQLEAFDLTNEERSELLLQIDTKLIEPRLENYNNSCDSSLKNCESERNDERLPKVASDVSELSTNDTNSEERYKEFEKQTSELQNGNLSSSTELRYNVNVPNYHCSNYNENLELLNKMRQSIRECIYDTVIDGANVGYYGLSSWYQQAKEAMIMKRKGNLQSVPLAELTRIPIPVDVEPKFSLMEDMRRTLIERNRKPVIVLHSRHIHKNMSGEASAFFAEWKRLNCVIECPPFLNDDYCWLFASICRPGVMVVTNDLMRDHHFSIFSPRLFIRWRQRFRITYRVKYSTCTSNSTIVLTTPKPYSTWVQRQRVPNSTCSRWHIPFKRSVSVIKQATNNPDTVSDFTSNATVVTNDTTTHNTLSKDGDDECEA